jgi:hypothetical protein
MSGLRAESKAAEVLLECRSFRLLKGFGNSLIYQTRCINQIAEEETVPETKHWQPSGINLHHLTTNIWRNALKREPRESVEPHITSMARCVIDRKQCQLAWEKDTSVCLALT